MMKRTHSLYEEDPFADDEEDLFDDEEDPFADDEEDPAEEEVADPFGESTKPIHLREKYRSRGLVALGTLAERCSMSHCVQ